jgi:redox-sensing transcriptional repressor
MTQSTIEKGDSLASDRLTVGVAARLSRYLQVLTQAKKQGRSSISSQEIGEYTHVNATQIRRDLSGFGKFGKRGVGYNIDFLIAEIRKILRTSGQHNIALVGAGQLGQAIASSNIFVDHGFHIAGVFDADPKKAGRAVDSLSVQPMAELTETIRDKNIIVGVLQLLGRSDRHPGRRHGSPQQPGRAAALRALLLPLVDPAAVRRLLPCA